MSRASPIQIWSKVRLTTLEVTVTQESFGWGTGYGSTQGFLGVPFRHRALDKQIVVSLDILLEIKDLWPKRRSSLYWLEVIRKIGIWGSSYQEDFQRLACPAYNKANPKLASHCLPFEIVWNLCLPSREQYGLYPVWHAGRTHVWAGLKCSLLVFVGVGPTWIYLWSHAPLWCWKTMPKWLTYLEANGGFMTLNDKSSPEEIKVILGISKASSKGFGWFDEGREKSARSIGTELIYEYLYLYFFVDDGAQSQSNAPKAIWRILHFMNCFSQAYMTSTRSNAICEEHASFSLILWFWCDLGKNTKPTREATVSRMVFSRPLVIIEKHR